MTKASTSASVCRVSTLISSSRYQVGLVRHEEGELGSGDRQVPAILRTLAHSTGSNFSKTFPYKLSLGKSPDGVPLLPFRPGRTSGDQILVTESYENTFRRLLHLRKNNEGDTQGVVLTGQPGIGAPL